MKKFNLWIAMVLLFTGNCFAQSQEPTRKLRTMNYYMDDSGRHFNPGEFIEINFGGQDIYDVTLDVCGESGSRATLVVDGYNKETKSLSSSREVKTWVVNETQIQRARINFSKVDPIVYSVTVRYWSDVEVKIETVIKKVEVEVAKKQIFAESHELLQQLDQLSDAAYMTSAATLIDEGISICEQLNMYAQKSTDSDASQFTQNYAQELIKTLDGKIGRQALRDLQKALRPQRELIRSIRMHLISLREMTDFFDCENTPFTENWAKPGPTEVTTNK